MKTNKYFQKQQPKLRFEAILKSALCGLTFGFLANFIVALATWFVPFNGLWLSIGILLGVTLLSAPIFYFTRFRPTDVKNARRIDRLGLEERLVTMVEYGNDDSYIAVTQRKDALSALSKVDTKQIKLSLSRAMIVSVIVCAIFGTGMTTVNALAESGILPGGDDLVNSFIEEKTTEYVTVSYVIDEGGIIEGDEDQIIVKGTDAATVTAVADDGYVFKEWSDGKTNPTRTDTAVTEDVVYTAVFIELGEGDGDGEGEEESDEPSDQPADPTENSSESSDPGDLDGNPSAGGGAYKPNNQIINGEIFYYEVLEEYQDAAEELIQSDDSGLSEAEKEIIKKYLEIV